MVKAYLRYEWQNSIGVICSRDSNVELDSTGKLAFSGCIEAVGVWNLRQGLQTRSLKTLKSVDRVTRLCISSSEPSICAVGYSDGSVRIWNHEQQVVIQTFQGHKSAVSCLAYNQSGHLLASGSNDTDIVLWDVVAESGMARLTGHVDMVTAVVFWTSSGSGGTGTCDRLISSSKDRFVRIWSVEHQLCLQVITEHKVEVWSLALNSSGNRLITGSSDHFLRLWALTPDSRNGTEETLATFMGGVPRTHSQGSTLALQFVTPKGCNSELLMCLSASKTFEVFHCYNSSDAKRRQKRREKRAMIKKRKKNQDGTDEPNADEQHDEGDQVTLADGKLLQGIHAADELAEQEPHRCGAKAVSFAWCEQTSTILIGLSNNVMESVQVKLPGEEDRSAFSGQCLSIDTPGHRTGIRTVAISHDDSLLMSTSAEAVKIWNTVTGNCIRTLSSGYGLAGFFLAGNDHVLIGTKEGHLELYDLRVVERVEDLCPHLGPIYGMAEAPDHKGFVTCSADKFVRCFELDFLKGTSESVACKEITERATEMPDECLAVAFCPNGKWLAVALLNHNIQLLFADTFKFYLSLYGHRLPVMALDITSDSQMIASGSADKNVKLWSTQFGNCHRSLRAHDDSVMQVKFMPSTHYLASAGRDRELKLWDCDSYELISVLHGHSMEIVAMAMSRDAAFIITAGSDKQMRFWRRGSEQMFISEEREKEMEEQFEQEVTREDLSTPGATQVLAARPSRRTIESVRSTERLMEIIDDALAQVTVTTSTSGKHPCIRVVQYVNTLVASNIYEVLLALPFRHALDLLQFIHQFFTAVESSSIDDASQHSHARVLSSAVILETPCQAALILTYVHHRELASTTRARGLLLDLRRVMRKLLRSEKDRIGLSMAGFAHMQRSLKRTSGSALAGPAEMAGSNGASPAAKKSRKKHM